MNKLFELARNGAMKAIAKTKKCSPEILVVVGITGVIAATVMACRATTKAGDILTETKESLDQVHKVQNDKDLSEKYTEDDARKDTVIIYVKTGWKFVKLYGPSALVGAASILAICASHGILKKRNVALASAYATLDQGFKKYKERVAERFGEDVEKEIRYGIKAQEFEKTVTTKDGKEKTVKETVKVVDGKYDISPYAKFFDESCSGWTKDPEQNLLFLRSQENYANNLLKARGYVVLNDIYRELGIPETNEGMVIGWIYRPQDNAYHNYIDFGLYNIDRVKTRDFVNGYERSVLLDFNVDGNIYGMI